MLKCCYLSTGGCFMERTATVQESSSDRPQTVSVEVLLSFHRGLFHGGDSDSTGIIAACCYGAAKGFQGVPEGNHKVNKPDVLSVSCWCQPYWSRWVASGFMWSVMFIWGANQLLFVHWSCLAKTKFGYHTHIFQILSYLPCLLAPWTSTIQTCPVSAKRPVQPNYVQ